ncbi:hypothetical protein QFC22_005698 [Naganishia vaughanmartiniae]|uniref:Uncharacterized protein n=1 Tax=Naganishia vaughanmartiniae TaxID=1424756 RepID=A0ACC2WS62_9TREE|nr:hypothetical protein QFC22_005698 [Naganishia vaughanmartiniae]
MDVSPTCSGTTTPVKPTPPLAEPSSPFPSVKVPYDARRPSTMQRSTSLNLGSFDRSYENLEERDESLAEWRQFLLKYSSGAFPPSEEPPMPSLAPASAMTSPLYPHGGQTDFPFHTHGVTMTGSNEDSARPLVEKDRVVHRRRDGSHDTSAEDLPTDMGTDFDKPVYDQIEITAETARRVRQFYKRQHYLPPPRAPMEILREQIIQEYDLYSPQQIQSIQVATDLVQAYFGGLCTFSLFQNNIQILMACAGPPEMLKATGLFPGKRLLPETSLCGHTALFPAGSSHVYIPDLSKDWRYKGNPYADEIKGVKTYIGAGVSLNVDPASSSSGQVVVIGVLNSMHLDAVLPPLTPEQSRVMSSVAKFLTAILRATWEGMHRTRDARSRRVVSDFLDHIMSPKSSKPTIISPSQQLRWHMQRPDGEDVGKRRVSDGSAGPAAFTSFAPMTIDDQMREDIRIAASKAELSPTGLPSVSSASGEEQDGISQTDPMERDAAILVKQIRSVMTEAESAAVVDLRSLHAFKDAKGAAKYVMDAESVCSLDTIAWDASSSDIERSKFLDAKARIALIKSLYVQQHDPEVAFEPQNNKTSGLEPYLPRSTRSHLIMPFHAGAQPLFSIIVTSSEKFWSFRTPDVNFVRSMGVILRAQVLQSRVIEADMAKTTFLSSISHELRTPMHGLMSGLQLLEEAIDGQDLEQAVNLLPIIKNSGYALQQILNDVLDFGQLAHGKTGSRTNEVDLAAVVISAVKTCMPRFYNWQEGHEKDVEISIVYEDLDWKAKIDESGFQRILFNGITNAMKVTQSGSITVFLESSHTVNGIVLKIVDTGPGIEPSFASKLFQPFSKANSFNPGAGLGLYITKALVDRMSGNISLYSTPGQKGSTFEVKLPVTLVKPVELDTETSKTVRKIINMDAERYHRRDPESKNLDTSNNVEKHATPMPVAPNFSDGAILSATIPADADAAIAGGVLNGDSSHGLTSSHSALRVLVADDNEISRKILLALLRKMSKTIEVEIAQANDGLQAVEAFEKFHPQLVLTDVSMPFMTGTKAAGEMRKIEQAEHRPKCKIFAITGLGSSDPRLKVEALREDVVDGWLVKGKDSLARIRDIVTDANALHRESEVAIASTSDGIGVNAGQGP